MRALLLVILLWPCLSIAQAGVPIPLPMDSSAGSAPTTSMMPNLLEQAYNNMLAGNYPEAETQYRTLSEQNSEDLSAWEGLMWAQNAQGTFKATLKLFGQLTLQRRMQKAMYNYPAYALLKSNRPAEARHYYQKAYDLDPGNPLANQISIEGLAYSYLALGDYPHYREQLNLWSARSGIPASKSKPSFRTSVFYNIPAKDKQAYGAGQSMSYKAWKVSAAYEDFLISNKQFRNILKADITHQYKPLDVSINARVITGDDERVYPAKQLGASLSPKLYPGKLAIKPQVFVSYSHYQRFDVQQISFIPQLKFRDIVLEAAVHYSYQDNEAVETDSSRYSYQAKIYKQLPYHLNLGLHYGSGNDNWLIDSSGALIDTFNQGSAYYGVSLMYPFLKRFSLYAYHQIDKTDKLWYISLAGSY